MTIEVFEPAPIYTIQGTGPYTIPHPYNEGAIRVSIVTDTNLIAVGSADFGVVPLSSSLTGDVTLAAAIAATYDGERLLIERETVDDQGWAGVLGEREKGLERQLDAHTMAIQEMRRLNLSTVRSVEPIGRIVPLEGHTLIFEGENIVPGPSAEDVANAQENAEAAALAAADAIAWTEWSVPGLAELLAATRSYPIGARITARDEARSYEVVSGAPSIITAGGIQLRPLPRDGVVTAQQCNIPTGGDQTALLQLWGQWAFDQGYALDLGGATFTASRLNFVGDATLSNGTLISNKIAPEGSTFQADVAFEFGGTVAGEIAVSTDFELGDDRLVLTSVAGIEVGDLLRLNSTRLIDTDHRGHWTEGQIVKVRRIAGTTVHLEAPLCYSGRASTIATGTISAISGDRYTLTVNNTIPGAGRDRIARVTITSGAASGEFRYAIAASGVSLRHSGSLPGEWDRLPWPAGVQVGNTYEHAWRSTVTIIKPARVNIRDMEFRRAAVLTATPGDLSFRGLRVQYCDQPRIENCTVNNFAQTNIHLSECWRPKVRACDVSGANLAYNGFSGTGYGVSIDTCSEARIEDVRGSGCRRIVDFSGAGGYSEHGLCDGVTGYGAGTTYAGLDFFPVGDQQQSVAGSHGSGRFTEYRNCKAVDCYVGMNLRGRGEVVTDFQHFGYGAYAVSINYGGGHTIDGVTYDDRFTEENRLSGSRHVISTRPGKRLDAVVFMDWADPFVGNIVNTIRNVRAKSVSQAGLLVQGTAAAIKNLVLENWHVTISDEGTADTNFAFLFTSGTATLDDCFFSNLKFSQPNGINYSGFESLLGIPSQNEVLSGGKIRVDDVWIARLPQNGVSRFECMQATAVVDIMNVRSLDRPRCNGIMVQDSSATVLNGAPDRVRVDVLASYPSDASGAASGNFGINLNSSAGFLSVVNNTGNDQTFRCRVT